MIARLAPVFGIMAIGLAGCGAAPLAQAALARLSGVNSAPAAVQAPKDGPAIMVTLASRGVKFQMRPLKRDGFPTSSHIEKFPMRFQFLSQRQTCAAQSAFDSSHRQFQNCRYFFIRMALHVE